MKILEAHNINKSYNSVNILNNVTLELEIGKIISIKGPSGSGKSTLLNILGLLDKYDDGNLIINKQVVNKNTYISSEFILNNIGFVFQFHHLLSEFTIFENLMIPQLNNTLIKEEKINNILLYLKHFDILGLKDKYPNQISGGERQKVAVIRSIINSPKIVFADEPTGNLDNNNTKNLLSIIKSIVNEKNMSFIIATHDDEVSKISDTCMFLKDGKLHNIIK